VLVLKFWRMHSGDWSSGFSKTLGTVSFLCALVAPLMIGSVFGLTESRVTYFGPVMSIYCLLMAFLSGTALWLFYSLLQMRISGNGMSEAKAAICDDFSRIFHYTLGTVIVFTLVRLAIESATVIPEFLNYHAYAQMFGGVGAVNTEIIIALLIPFIIMTIPALRGSNPSRLTAAALVLVGTLAMHMEILIGGQSRPVGPKAEQFTMVINYFPSLYEWLILVFALAVMMLLYLLGERFLKLEPSPA